MSVLAHSVPEDIKMENGVNKLAMSLMTKNGLSH